MVLNQKTLLEKREFEIVEDGIKVKTKSNGVYDEFIVSFERITDEVRLVEEKEPVVMVIGIIALFFPLWFIFLALLGVPFRSVFDGIMIGLIFVFLGMMSFMLYFIMKQCDLLLMCNDDKAIYFFSNRPSRNKVEEFIQLVVQKRNEYMIKEYASFDEDLGVEEYIVNLYKLKLNGIITEDEYRNFKKSVNIPVGVNKIGF